MALRSICGVILVSEDPARLADFYGKVLGCRFEREDHAGLAPHFGADIGEVHFGIHPPANFGRERAGSPSTVVAFDVDSIAEAMKTLQALGAEQLEPPHDEGFGKVTSYLDPDGNAFELVELAYEFPERGDR